MNKKKKWLKNVSEDYLRENINSFRWCDICENKTLSESFLREFAKEIYWPTAIVTQSFSKDFIREFRDLILDGPISLGDSKYDEKFLEEIVSTFEDNEKSFIVYNICVKQDISEHFVEKYKQYIDWKCVSMYQKLTPEFMRKYKHLLCWSKIVSRGVPIPEDLKEYVMKKLMIERALSDIE